MIQLIKSNLLSQKKIKLKTIPKMLKNENGAADVDHQL